MKVYISADIEGIAGITHWDEADKTHDTYPEFREEMTNEVAAACEGAVAAGAREILIKDAHGSGRNIIAARLPDCVRLIRGWSGHPFCMVQEIDRSFDAAMFIGYHSKAGAESNPLAHTLTLDVSHIKLNGARMSEFVMHSYAAALVGVPVVFISGDKGICADARAFNRKIGTAAVFQGIGRSTVSIAPGLAQAMIRDGAAAALNGNLAACKVKLPKKFTLDVTYANPTDAYRASWYPGARHVGQRTVRFESRDYFEILRALRFIA
ncbi:MAG TPA: M55 family metallopeptidase [Dongiaceae bacterium]